MKSIITIVLEQDVPERLQDFIRERNTGSNVEQMKADIIEVIETELASDGKITVDVKLIETKDNESFRCKKCNRELEGGYCLQCDR